MFHTFWSNRGLRSEFLIRNQNIPGLIPDLSMEIFLWQDSHSSYNFDNVVEFKHLMFIYHYKQDGDCLTVAHVRLSIRNLLHFSYLWRMGYNINLIFFHEFWPISHWTSVMHIYQIIFMSLNMDLNESVERFIGRLVVHLPVKYIIKVRNVYLFNPLGRWVSPLLMQTNSIVFLILAWDSSWQWLL